MRIKKKKPDKRRHVRVQPEKKRPVEININGQNFLTIIYANDISEGGIGIIVPEKFKGCKINNNVSLVITLPKPFKKSFLVTGRIIHVINEKFGVEFLDLTKENRRILKKYINSRLQDEPEHNKEKKFLKYVLIVNISIGAVSLIFLGNLIYSSKTNEDLHIPIENKQIVKTIQNHQKKAQKEPEKQVETNDEPLIPVDQESQFSVNDDEYYADEKVDEIENNRYIVRYDEPDKDNNVNINEYDSVMLSDIAGKKLKFRGGKWYFFHYNNTVGVNHSDASETSYFYASNYYINDNQIVIEISYEEKSVITFLSDNIMTNEHCTIEKIIDDEQVSKKETMISKIADIDQ